MNFGSIQSALMTVALSSALAACGGGGGGNSSASNNPGGGSPTPENVTVSGIAAFGSPISGGTVTLKDANGTLKSTTTGSNGAYSIDVTGLATPFTFELIGLVGGDQVVLHSVTDSAPSAGGVVTNITPLTEAIVANIAGGDPAAFFTAPVPSKVTPAAVQAAQTALKTALSPVLTAAGVSVNVDLLKSSFLPNKTGLDAVLDIVRVSVSVSNGTPVIKLTNKLNEDQVVTLTGSGAATQTGALAQATLPDLSKLDAVATRFTAAIASQSSLASLLPAMFDDNYLEDGEGKNAVVARLQGNAGLVGASASAPVVKRCNAAGDICRIAMTLRYADNKTIDAFTQSVKKQSDGTWKLYGNQYHHDFVFVSYASKAVRIDGATPPAPKSGIVFAANDLGLGAILYLQDPAGGADKELWRTSGVHLLSDAEIDQLMPKNGAAPKFRIRVFSDGNFTTPAGTGTEGNGVYSELRLDGLPLKSDQFATAPFPALTNAAIANLKALGVTGALNLSWTFSPQAPVDWISANLVLDNTYRGRAFGQGALFGLSQISLQAPDTTGTATASSSRAAGVGARDSTGRQFWTFYYGCGGATTCLTTGGFGGI